jgi:hypothetical protein
MIREQADGFWGAGGRIYTINEDIAPIALAGEAPAA